VLETSMERKQTVWAYLSRIYRSHVQKMTACFKMAQAL